MNDLRLGEARHAALDRRDFTPPGAGVRDELSKRHFCFLTFWMASFLVFHRPLASVLARSLGDERYSHIPAIPLVSALLIYLKRRWIFRVRQWRPRLGAVLLAAAAPLALLPRQVFFAKPDTALFCGVLAMILVWTAGFVFCYGTQAYRSALFSFFFLFLAVPLPTTWLDRIVLALQKGSAAASYVIFKVLGVPVLRDGFHFSLPGVDIEIARQCSGFNSGLALFIAGLLSAHLFLRFTWSKALLIAVVVPLLIVKNAVRIVTISWLAVYVNRDYLYGDLHRHGGPLFAVMGLALLLSAVMALRRWEAWSSQRTFPARLDYGVTETVIEDTAQLR
jgi:exosortase